MCWERSRSGLRHRYKLAYVLYPNPKLCLHKAGAAGPRGLSCGQGSPDLRSGGRGEVGALATSCCLPAAHLFLQPTGLSGLGPLTF